MSFIDSDLLNRGGPYRVICYIEVALIDSDLLYRGGPLRHVWLYFTIALSLLMTKMHTQFDFRWIHIYNKFNNHSYINVLLYNLLMHIWVTRIDFFIWSRNFASTWCHPQIFVGCVLLICLVVLCCPIMILYVLSFVLWCRLRFPNKSCSVRFYLQLFIGGFMSYLRYLCLFVYSGVQHILCCVFVDFFCRLVYPMFLVYFVLPFGIL